MSKPGRNDLCTCGSGLKFKKCCQLKDDGLAGLRREEQSAVQTALDWIKDHYPEEVGATVHFDFMDEPDDDRLDAIDDLPPELQQAISINIGEWLLTDASLSINGEETPAINLILGAKGPHLTQHGREWLLELGRHTLSLYEVREVKKGEGLLLADMLYPDQPPVWIREKRATDSLVPWDTFGTRLVWQNDCFVMSGAAYPMDRETAIDCLEEIRDEIEFEDGDPTEVDHAFIRYVLSSTIIDYWLDSLLEEKPLPSLVDTSSGQKINLTTDHYRVVNWKALEKILDAQEDVDGDRADGWTRFVELEDGRCRARASLTAKKKDTLEVFCRTVQLADEARAWLEDIAGSTITYKIRDMVDPRSEKAQKNAKPLPECDIPQDIQRQIIHQYLAKHYETWPKTPLPALDGKSPLEAVKTKQGRPKVLELLKSIDQLEARRIVQTGGEPFDVSFLWKRLGLER